MITHTLAFHAATYRRKCFSDLQTYGTVCAPHAPTVELDVQYPTMNSTTPVVAACRVFGKLVSSLLTSV